MDEWLSRLESMQLKRSELNLLIMDYLMAEGFKEAAERFKCEANIDTEKMSEMVNIRETSDQMDRRIEVRNAIEDGKIKEAMNKINEYYPELIDNNRHLYFKLQQQQLIELIRDHLLEEALQFSQQQLSVDGDYLQLPELERTLSLLAFEKPENSPYADLMHASHRQQLASELNEAILKEESGEGHAAKPKLVSLIKLLLWTQNELEKKKVKFTKISDLMSASFSNGD
ncbi:glucose-induced degradation protein 8 homolog [Oppia nitens]|uniref:glucose-induced degradation protein 8 homolog n=1 Tax=Oppia nitens TaxID=1686743 RepID=UPI0023DA3324|nr:glucose-induced degradation protein 8 homolog [Oppia nitens]